MEELLNKLIEKGWNPFGGYKHSTPRESCNVYGRYITFYCNDGDYDYPDYKSQDYNIRELVAKESGLWQFVCENGMVKKDQYTNTTRIQEYEDERDSETYRTKYDEGSYLFRLIESSLCDEDKLEEFLFQNIKIEGKNE